MNVDVKRLKDLAEAATPGPWEHRYIEEEEMPGAIAHNHGWINEDFSEQAFKDVAYMAMANPAAILELIAEIERLRQEMHAAAIEVESWGAYASDYFKDKHDLDGTVARIRACAKLGGES